MNYDAMCAQLADLVLARNVIKFGSFELSSGQRSALYYDGRILSTDPVGAYLIGNMIVEFIKEIPVDAIGGPSIGADPIAMSVTMAAMHRNLHIPMFMVRNQAKTYGRLQQIEGNLPPNSEVAIVDDTCATGESLLSTIDAIEKAGSKVKSIYVIFNRREMQGDEKVLAAGHSLITLLTSEDLIAAMARKIGSDFADYVNSWPDFMSVYLHYLKIVSPY